MHTWGVKKKKDQSTLAIRLAEKCVITVATLSPPPLPPLPAPTSTPATSAVAEVDATYINRAIRRYK